MSQVSVIIPSYNSAATVLRTLNSLFEQEPAGFLKEVLVVDSSDDGVTDKALSGIAHEKLRIVKLPARAIPAAGRNAGAKLASAGILAFIDSDATAAPGWIKNIVSAYECGNRVGGGAIRLAPEQSSLGLAVTQYFLQFSEFMGGEPQAVLFAPSCNVFCEKKLFEEVGGFPDIRAAEDVLFGAKFSGKVPYYFNPAMRVHHIFTLTWKRYRTNQKLLGEYTLVCRRKLEGRWMYRGVFPLLLAPVFFMTKLFRIYGRVRRSQDRELHASFFRHLPLLCVGLLFLTWGFSTAGFRSWKS